MAIKKTTVTVQLEVSYRDQLTVEEVIQDLRRQFNRTPPQEEPPYRYHQAMWWTDQTRVGTDPDPRRVLREAETVWCEAHGGLANPHFVRGDCVHPHFTDQATRARMNRAADAPTVEQIKDRLRQQMDFERNAERR